MKPSLCSACGAESSAASVKGLCPRCLFLLAAEEDAPATAFDTRPAAPGEVIRYLGDYEILAEIARGGMGAVYRARQVSLNRTVALKLMLSGEYASRSERERFRNEAEGAAKLQHPNIVSIHEIGSAHGQPYFSMDFVEGESLAELLRRQPPTPLQAAEWIVTLSEAVEYAHRQGILHRDLKPQNVLVDKSGRLRITDFGLSKRLDSGDALTVTGAVLGTPGYMAPEQAGGQPDLIGPATDVYGLGAMLYEMLTGRPPFRESTAARTIVKVIEDEPVRPSKIAPAIPPDLETIALKCLEKSPSRRYPSARHLAQELNRFIRGEPILAAPATLLRRAGSWCVRRPWVITGVAGVLLIGLLGAVYGLWESNRYLLWQASGAPRPKFSDTWLGLIMVLMLLGFFFSLGAYGLAARRKNRGEKLTPGQLQVIGSLGLFQVFVTSLSALAVTGRAAWREVEGPPFPAMLSVHLLYLWPGLLLCWETLTGNVLLRRGSSPRAAAPVPPRLAFNMGASMAALILFLLFSWGYARIIIPDGGYEQNAVFRRANYPAGLSEVALNKWWAMHMDFLRGISATFRSQFVMTAVFIAILLPSLRILSKDPRGHWRRILPLFLLANACAIALFDLGVTGFRTPLHLLAQAILLGLLASIFILKLARVRVTSEPPVLSFGQIVPLREVGILLLIALPLNLAAFFALRHRDLIDLIPASVFASALAALGASLFPSWHRFSLDDKLAFACALVFLCLLSSAALFAVPAGLAAILIRNLLPRFASLRQRSE